MAEQALDTLYESNSTHGVYTMSWTAYVRPTIVLVVALLIATSFYSHEYYKVAGTIALIFGALAIYQFLSIRSVTLFTNNEGVWVSAGVLPWEKGSSGVKWRDLDEAVFFMGFWSWLLRSYTVRVGHRFTKDSEIVLPHISHGRNAVEHINELHRIAIERDGNL